MNKYLDKNVLAESVILELLREDDKEAFNILYSRYWSDLYRVAFNILKDRDQSMDIVQEIFIWLWQHRRQLTIKTTLKGYLLAAVKFKTANFIRNGKIREGFFKQIEAIQSLPVSNFSNSALEIKELEDVIRQTVNQLPNKCKTVYMLSRDENLSNKEIAGELGISVKTVENQITIALKRLRAAMAQLLVCIVILFLF